MSSPPAAINTAEPQGSDPHDVAEKGGSRVQARGADSRLKQGASFQF